MRSDGLLNALVKTYYYERLSSFSSDIYYTKPLVTYSLQSCLYLMYMYDFMQGYKETIIKSNV